jgi:hypothetical protein
MENQMTIWNFERFQYITCAVLWEAQGKKRDRRGLSYSTLAVFESRK